MNVFSTTLNNLELWCSNNFVVVNYLYNLTASIVLRLLRDTGSDSLNVSIVSNRFSREMNTPNKIIYSVTGKNGMTETFSRNFIKMPDKRIRLRSLSSFFPVVQHVYQYILTSLHMEYSRIDAVRYDIETGSVFLSVPNNPTAANTAVVSRSMDTRTSGSFAFTVTSIWCPILLMLFKRHYKTILSDDRLTNYFTHYLLVYFTDSRVENFFNCNFNIDFGFHFDTKRIKDITPMPTTVAAECGLKTSVIDNSSSMIVCETLLFMFDIQQNEK